MKKYTMKYLTSFEGRTEYYERLGRAYAFELERQRRAKLERKITRGHDTVIPTSGTCDVQEEA